MKILLIILGLTIPLIVNSQVDGMVQIGNIYIDKYEAPNVEGETPFVMFTYNEAQCWCLARGKRLLFDDEWVIVAEGPDSLPYVYGNTYNSQVCNDSKTWISPDQSLLNLWPTISYLNNINSFDELIDSVLITSSDAAQSANHVVFLYQADTAGSDSGCYSYYGVFDLNGNVSEWTTRRDGGSPGFHGNLKGGYWSAPSTIQASITAHGDNFRYYQTGFRCAKDSTDLAIPTIKNNFSFSIYPNPTSDKITISMSKISNETQVSISDIQGKQILNTVFHNKKVFELNVSNFAKGIYLIKINTDNAIVNKKLIIQ